MTEPNAEALSSRDSKSICIDAILNLEFPSRSLLVAMANSVRTLTDVPQLKPIHARQAELEAFPIKELTERLAQLKSQAANRAEAARFYNKPEAKANFAEWLALDFWTIDESVALLLGRDPRVVNKQTIALDLEKPKGFFGGMAKPPSRFTKLFAALLLRAERSAELTASGKVSPLQAARWGQSQLLDALPAPLAQFISQTVLEPDTSKASAAEAEPKLSQRTLVTRSALINLEPTWPSVRNDLSHSDRNGLADAAKAEGRNQWFKESAIEWAERNGKIPPQLGPQSASVFPSRVHRMKG